VKQNFSLDYYPGPPESASVESASRECLQQMQEERLRALIRRAWERVPFYRERWEKAGLRPEAIRSLKELERLPVVGRRDFEESLKLHPPFGDYQGDFNSVRVQASSGTSGRPKPFFQTRNDWDVIANFWARRFHAQGVRPGEIVQIVFAYSLFIAGFTATEGAMRLGSLVVPTGSGAITSSERQVRILREWGTQVLVGTPTYVLHLADVAEKMGLDTRKDFSLRRAIHTAEPMSEPARKTIEERWHVAAYDSFGSVETGAPTFECERKNGYHVNEDGYLFEILDPESLRPLPDGQEGLVAVTSLFKEAAPVIRYNLEDVSSFLPGPCRCGRTFKRLAKVKGRASEMLKIRGAVFYPTMVETALEKIPELTREYLLVVDRVGQLDCVTLQVECRSQEGNTPLLKSRLETELRATTGLSIEARLFGPGELARALQVAERVKAKRILDRRGENRVS
jgi:phenylacetate-CoA ligase